MVIMKTSAESPHVPTGCYVSACHQTLLSVQFAGNCEIGLLCDSGADVDSFDKMIAFPLVS